MKNKNDLRGLNLVGFQNSDEDFTSVFNDNKTVELLRPEIRKYFSKIKTVNRNNSSYGLKHIAERHLGTYVSNGELIYAMHLEGYKIYRESINCSFNVSQASVRHLINANSILTNLSTPLNRKITDYLKYRRRPYKYKYYFKFLIESKFGSESRLRRDVIAVLSKEINETPETVKSWINMLAFVRKEIPADKLEMLSKIFNIPTEELKNEESEMRN